MCNFSVSIFWHYGYHSFKMSARLIRHWVMITIQLNTIAADDDPFCLSLLPDWTPLVNMVSVGVELVSGVDDKLSADGAAVVGAAVGLTPNV